MQLMRMGRAVTLVLTGVLALGVLGCSSGPKDEPGVAPATPDPSGEAPQQAGDNTMQKAPVD